jgi:hypothetical protein
MCRQITKRQLPITLNLSFTDNPCYYSFHTGQSPLAIPFVWSHKKGKLKRQTNYYIPLGLSEPGCNKNLNTSLAITTWNAQVGNKMCKTWYIQTTQTTLENLAYHGTFSSDPTYNSSSCSVVFVIIQSNSEFHVILHFHVGKNKKFVCKRRPNTGIKIFARQWELQSVTR